MQADKMQKIIEAPASLPESMSRDEMLRYYSEYANMVAHEVLGYQRRIRELEAALSEARSMQEAQAGAPWWKDPRNFDSVEAMSAASPSPVQVAAGADRLRVAAQAVLDRWDSPTWDWNKQGPTADLMFELRDALAAAPLLEAGQGETKDNRAKGQQ